MYFIKPSCENLCGKIRRNGCESRNKTQPTCFYRQFGLDCTKNLLNEADKDNDFSSMVLNPLKLELTIKFNLFELVLCGLNPIVPCKLHCFTRT